MKTNIIKKNFRVLLRGIKLINKLSPGFVLCCIIQSALKAILPFINIYMSAVIINGITEKQSLEMLLIYVSTMVGLNLLCTGISSIVDKAVNLKQNCLLTQYNWHLNKKMLELSYADVESYEIHALKEKINQMQNVNGMGLWNLINPIKSIVQSIFSVLFAITIIFPLFITNSTEIGRAHV